jgi:hypothetical protein
MPVWKLVRWVALGALAAALPWAMTAPLRAAAKESELSTEQQRIRDRYLELRGKLTHLADLLAPSNPRQAALLRQAVARGQESGTDQQLAKVLDLLQKNQLSSSVKGQIEIERELSQILDVLQSEDRTRRLEAEKARLREYLRRISSLLREQKVLRTQTEGESKLAPLAENQQKLAEQTDDLATQVEKTEGAPSQGADSTPAEPASQAPEKKDTPPKQPDKKGPGDQPSAEDAGEEGEAMDDKPASASDNSAQNPTQRRLERAQKAMRQAEKKLRGEDRKGAEKKQAESIAELERAKASLEEIMRQLREEEHGQTLKVLLARFQEMLHAQTELYENTQQLDRQASEKQTDEVRMEVGRLAQRELAIVADAERALLVLKEEPTAEAFAEGVTQLRDDLRQVAELLADHKTGAFTQTLERDTVAALEDLVGSMRRAQKELAERKAEREAERQRNPGQGQQMAGEPPLVDKLQDLRMIRALQVRINKRTSQLGGLVAGEEADKAEVQSALRELAVRQERLEKITRELSQGKKP